MYASSSGQLDEFLTIVKKRKWQIFLPSIFVFCLGVAAALIIPQKYHAESKFELRYVRTVDNRKDPERTSTALEVQNADQHLANFERVRLVIESLGWEDYENIKKSVDRSEYIRRHKESIEVVKLLRDKSKTGSAFIEVWYKNVDRQRSMKFLEALISSWHDELIARDETLLSAERDQLQNNRNQRKGAYEEAMNDLERVEKELGILSWTGTGPATSSQKEDPYIAELGVISIDLTRAEAAHASASKKKENLRGRIVLELDTVLVDQPAGRSDLASQALRLESEISGLRAQQQGLTTRHSNWQRLQTEIERKDSELARLQSVPDEVIRRQEERPNTKKLQLIKDVELLEGNIAALEGEIQQLAGRKLYLTEIQEHRLTLRRQLTAANSRVALTQRLYEDAAILLQFKQDALAKLITANSQPFIWSKRPWAPADPTEPNPLLIVAVGLAAGLALGLGSSMLLEFTKSCYRSVGDVTAVMTLPVLGVVSEIVTSHQKKAARWRGAVVLSSSAVMIGVIAWFTWAYTRRPDILPSEFIQQIEEIRGNFK